MTLEPVDYAIISQSLIAVAREMGVKLVKSAYSTVLREARDGSAALLDANGNTIAQAELIPMQLGTIGHIFRPCQALYPNETLRPGDFFVINDPYSGGQHLQDVFLFLDTIRENIRYGRSSVPDPHLAAVVRIAHADRFAVSDVDLCRRIAMVASVLSWPGGQKYQG